jgi:hypothetical protein
MKPSPQMPSFLITEGKCTTLEAPRPVLHHRLSAGIEKHRGEVRFGALTETIDRHIRSWPACSRT